jgi:hypothetical protein
VAEDPEKTKVFPPPLFGLFGNTSLASFLNRYVMPPRDYDKKESRGKGRKKGAPTVAALVWSELKTVVGWVLCLLKWIIFALLAYIVVGTFISVLRYRLAPTHHKPQTPQPTYATYGTRPINPTYQGYTICTPARARHCTPSRRMKA